MADPVSSTTILCRKCGAEGTHHCSMPGCPLPDIKAQSETTVEFTPGLIEVAALKQQVYAEIRQAYTRACLKAFEEWQAEIKANDRTSRGSPYL